MIVLLNVKARGRRSEKGSRIIWEFCVCLNAKENFNEYNSSKLHTDDSGSYLVWYFQENTVTLATSISHGTCCSLQNVSKSKVCPSGRDHSRKWKVNKPTSSHNELCYLPPWQIEDNLYLNQFFFATILSNWQYVYYMGEEKM